MRHENIPFARLLRLAILAALPAVALAAMLATGNLTSRAVQNPSISIDMVTTGNSYVEGDDEDADGFPDPGTNHMTVGTINNCLTTAAPGNNLTHTHTTHLIIQNVEDLIAWQVRFNYLGDQMRPRPSTPRPLPTALPATSVGFVNLPIDRQRPPRRNPRQRHPGRRARAPDRPHRRRLQRRPDLPGLPGHAPKAVHDEANQTYGTTGGGILATLTLQVLAGNAGNPSLFMNLDDGSPNPPESGLTSSTAPVPRPSPLPSPSSATATTARARPACRWTASTPSARSYGNTRTSEPPTPTPPPANAHTNAASSDAHAGTTRHLRSAGVGDVLPARDRRHRRPAAHGYLHAGRQRGLTPGHRQQPSISASALTAHQARDDTGDYNFGGVVDLSPTVPDDAAIPVGAILGRLGSQPTLGLLNNTCTNSQLRVPFTFLKGTTDINDTVHPQPFGESNDLAIMAGDNPPYSGHRM